MNELTLGDLIRIREDLEGQAALALGRAMFAFSGLDLNLGLMVASMLRDKGKHDQASKVDLLGFNSRLEAVQSFASTSSDLPAEAATALQAWVTKAHTARLLRNDLAHGRWNVDPNLRKVLNIVGLPSSDSQRTVKYTIEELDAVGQNFRRLNSDLSGLRMQWQLP